MEHFSRLDAFLTALKSQKLLNKLGLGAEHIILDRTRKGLGADGTPLQGYSESYKKVRERAGLGTGKVDLYFDHVDGMLLHVDHVINNNFESVRVYINDPEKSKIAGYHDKYGAGKKKIIRHWWGIELPAELQKMKQLAIDTLKLIIQDF